MMRSRAQRCVALLSLAAALSSAAPLDTWTLRDSGTSASLLGVAFGNRTFVVVGERGMVLTSTNGVTWIGQQSLVTNSLHEICYGHGLFIAVGDQGTILTSTNGVAWQNAGLQTNAWLRGITSATTGFVAVGFSEVPPRGDMAVILRSLDGLNWTIAPTDINNRLESVAFAGDRYVAVAYGAGDTFVSSDAITWSFVELPSHNALFGVTYGVGLFVIGGVDTYTPGFPVFVSPNTQTWQAAAAPGISIYGVAFGAGTFVAVGETFTEFEFRCAISVSRDAFSWTLQMPGVKGRLNSAAYGNSSFVAVGNSGVILQSGPLSGVLAIVSHPTGMELRVTGEEGLVYKLQAANRLPELNWSDITVVSNASSGTFYFDSSAPNYTNRFYRLLLQ